MVDAMEAYRAAEKADHRAEQAQMSIDAHEKICAERYSNIATQLKDVKEAQGKAADAHKASQDKIYTAIDELRKTAYKAGGIDLAVRYGCLFIGAIGVIYGIMR